MIFFMKKRIVSLLLVIILAAVFIPAVQASAASPLSNADILNALGLFNGTGTTADGKPIYSLEKAPTRAEALVMLIRLMGEEAAAKGGQASHPFDDVPDWAQAYVGYAYESGLTNGISESKFGSQQTASAGQYAAFLLRALGYNESAGDFTYDNALAKLYQLGMTDAGTYQTKQEFTRRDVVELSYSALYLSPKGQSKPLVNILLWKDVFTTQQLNNTYSGRLLLAADAPDMLPDGLVVSSIDELKQIIRLAIKNSDTNFSVSAPGFTGEQLSTAFWEVYDEYHPQSILPLGTITHWNGYLEVEITLNDYVYMESYYKDPERFSKNYKIYRTDLMTIDYTDNYYHMLEWIETVNKILEKTVTPSMTEAEKVKAIHDYIVRNTVYKLGNYLTHSEPHLASTVVFKGYGVCDAYSGAFKILMNALGIECNMIYGDVPQGPHAWNQVKIDGVWYNIDVTWGDADTGDRIYYDYFCKSDSSFGRDHIPDKLSVVEKCSSSLVW